jgi:NaMN:DMB phosphoribosyltransferase
VTSIPFREIASVLKRLIKRNESFSLSSGPTLSDETKANLIAAIRSASRRFQLCGEDISERFL